MAKKTEVKMLTAREFAEQSGAGESSVRLWAKEGKLAGARLEETPVGSFWLIPATALQGFQKPKRGRPAGAKSKSAKKTPKPKQRS